MLEFKYFDYVFDHEPAGTIPITLGKDPDGFAVTSSDLYTQLMI